MKNNSNRLAVKMLISMVAGIVAGLIFMAIRESLVGKMTSEGTTPRRIPDLIGSLCDLTSGSGDKGTPIIYIQGYFDTYVNE